MSGKPLLPQMRIAVVDDHDLIREGAATILLNAGVGDVEMFGNARGLVERLDDGVSFDFYIIDLELPDLDGFVLIEMIRARINEARIIVSTVHDELWTLRKLLARNVDAIIYKSATGGEIIAAIREVMSGGRYYCEAVRDALASASDSSIHPTSRELEVLCQIAGGKTTKEIAAALFVSENTIEAHRKALFTKLKAVNVADLIVKAIEKGYLKKGGIHL